MEDDSCIVSCSVGIIRNFNQINYWDKLMLSVFLLAAISSLWSASSPDIKIVLFKEQTCAHSLERLNLQKLYIFMLWSSDLLCIPGVTAAHKSPGWHHIWGWLMLYSTTYIQLAAHSSVYSGEAHENAPGCTDLHLLRILLQVYPWCNIHWRRLDFEDLEGGVFPAMVQITQPHNTRRIENIPLVL